MVIRIVFKPTKASKILQELQEQSMSNLWWDDETQKVRFKVFAPDSPGESDTYDSFTDLISIKSISVKQNEKARLSRVIIYFNKNDIGNSKDPEDFDGAFISIDTDKESADEYNEQAIKTIYSRWIDDVSACSVISNRFRRRFNLPPKKLTIITELKDDDTKTADIANISTSLIQNIDGTDLTLQPFQVTKKQRRTKGTIQFEVLDTAWNLQYGFIAPAGQPDWDAASEDERRYAYICDRDELIGADNSPAFYIF